MKTRRVIRPGFQFTVLVFFFFFLISWNTSVWAAQYETENFTVDGAPTLKLAKEFCETAERCRYEMALLWLGEAMPDWSAKCPIKVKVGRKLGAGGATSFIFQGGEVYGWEMDIQGSAERILDSVLPHEITHMVFASHFRRPIPRWLDEGAATSVECEEEKENYRNKLRYYIRKDVQKCLPCRRMLALKEYPEDVIPFYAQGFSVVEYLILLGGRQELMRFAETGMKTKDWDNAFRQHYGFENLGDFQANYWVKWVAAGSPTNLSRELYPNGFQLASTKTNPSDRLNSDVTTADYTARPFEDVAKNLTNLVPTWTTQSVANGLSETLPQNPISLVSAKASPAYGQIFSGEVYNGVYSSNSIRTEIADAEITDDRNETTQPQRVAPIPASWKNEGNPVDPIPSSFEKSATSILPATVYDSTSTATVFR